MMLKRSFFFIYISKDNEFHEHVFPCQHISSQDRLVDPFLELVTPAIFEFAGIPSNEARTSTLAKEVVATPTNYNVDYEQHNCAPVENQATFESQASNVIPNNVPTTSQSIRWSTRLTKPPSYLREYHCNLLQESSMSNVSAMPTKFPIQKLMSYNKLSSSYKKFLLNVTSTFEPQFYHHVVPFKKWHDTMTDELKATETNEILSVVPLPLYRSNFIRCPQTDSIVLFLLLNIS